MRGRLATAFVIAACSGGDVLVVEVIVPENMAAQQVELFIADDVCEVDLDNDGILDACRVITPDLQFPIQSDEIYFTDKDGITPQPATGPGTYVFRLERGTHDDAIPVMVAVASTQDGPTGVAILREWSFSEGPLRLQVRLDDSKTRFVHVWRNAAATCLAVERDSSDAVFLVSREDPDCDGLTARDADVGNIECDPLEWNGRVPAPSGAITCIEHSARGECLLGEQACVDGVGPQDCALTQQCVPLEYCSLCDSPAKLPLCLEQVNILPTMVNLACDVRTREIGVGLLSTCDPASSEADVPVDLDVSVFTGNGKCDGIAFAPFDDPQTFDLSRYQSDLKIQTGMVLGDPDTTMRFTVETLAERCQFRLRWQGPAPGTALRQFPYKSMMALRTRETMAPRFIMVPVEIRLSDCAGDITAGTCAIAGDPASSASLRLCAD